MQNVVIKVNGYFCREAMRGPVLLLISDPAILVDFFYSFSTQILVKTAKKASVAIYHWLPPFSP